MSAADDPVFAFLDGKHYVLDGVSGAFRYRQSRTFYGYTEHRLHHEPDARGRRAESYRHIRRELGDDHSTDLTDNVERYCAIATELGFGGAS